MARKKRSRRSGCTLVTFKRRTAKGKVLPKGKQVTVERCEGRKLSTSAKRRFTAMKRRGDICIKKSGSIKRGRNTIRGSFKLFSNRC